MPSRLLQRALVILALCSTVVACSTLSSVGDSVSRWHDTAQGRSAAPVDASARMMLLPVTRSQATTAQSSASASLLLETELRRRGLDIVTMPTELTPEATAVAVSGSADAIAERVRSERVRLDGWLDAAQAQGARYAITTHVDTWRPGTAANDRAAVALHLILHDVLTRKALVDEQLNATGAAENGTTQLAQDELAHWVDTLHLTQTRPDQGTGSGAADDSASPLGQVALGTTDTGMTGSAGIGTLSGLRTLQATSPKLANAPAVSRQLDGRSVAFYYGQNPAIDVLGQFDRVILEPDNITAEQHEALEQRGAATFAYLSVGETGPERPWFDTLDDSWVLGRNAIWNSAVMDLRSAGWRAFLAARIDTLMQAGYDGLFLDTLDSYQLYANDAPSQAAHVAALTSFLTETVQRHPGIRLIANRGFDALETAGNLVEAVAAESLYASWDHAAQRYTTVPEADRTWLLQKLEHLQTKHSLDVIVIDYVPPTERKTAREVAAGIASHGFIPWVATPTLDSIGVGAIEVLPREVLMLFDSRIHGVQEVTEVHRILATPIEYLGYVPVYLDMAKEALPVGDLKGRYAGVISWSRQLYPDADTLQSWIKRQVASQVPVVLFGQPGFNMDRELSRALGVSLTGGLDAATTRTVTRDAMMGFEREPIPRLELGTVTLKNTGTDNHVHYAVQDQRGQRSDLVITASWGGYAAQPGVIELDGDKTTYWILDPFTFLKQALQLPDAPMPDVTTENGQRIFTAHIDGDALPSWAEMPGHQLGAEVIRKRILDVYPLPHTISVVEGEIDGVPAWADRKIRMIGTMRSMFALPQVEIASHTFSHPFDWGELAASPGADYLNLPIRGYRYSPEREVGGSAAFINRVLAPHGKRTEVMLWSGSALPDAAALQASVDAGLLNVNGGDTIISKKHPTVSAVTPMARTVDDLVQVYAPIANENIYTNEWKGPFDGFRRVIETLSMTDKPRRLKPHSLYYHFYAGTKAASILSLEEVYDWSLSQSIFPVPLSHYAKLVPAFRHAGVARRLDGSWQLDDLGPLRSLRLIDDTSSGYQFARVDSTTGIVGAKQLHDGLYLHTDGRDRVIVDTGGTSAPAVQLVSANGQVARWDQRGGSLHLRIRGEVPVVLELSGSGVRGCALRGNRHTVNGTRTENNTFRYAFSDKDTGNVTLDCPA